MPFVVTKVISRPIGIEALGKLYMSDGTSSVSLRIVQESAEASFCRTLGQLRIGFSLIQNTNPILSVLNESPILLKKEPDLQHLTLSSFILTRDGEVEEITLSVLGTEIDERPT